MRVSGALSATHCQAVRSALRAVVQDGQGARSSAEQAHLVERYQASVPAVQQVVAMAGTPCTKVLNQYTEPLIDLRSSFVSESAK